jgi:hypothetical protein
MLLEKLGQGFPIPEEVCEQIIVIELLHMLETLNVSVFGDGDDGTQGNCAKCEYHFATIRKVLSPGLR